MSTALGRALNESGAISVFVNEPFNLHNGDVNIAAGHVLLAVEPALSSAREPVVVLTKNIAGFLTAPVFRTWLDVCSSVVWCVRDPRKQISSLVTRTVNGLLFDVGSDRLKQSDLLPSHVAAATEWLRNSQVSKDFSLAGWRTIGAHFGDNVGGCPSFVADGSLFSRMPDRLLPYLCSELGIEFRNRMIDGWDEPFVNVHRLTTRSTTTRLTLGSSTRRPVAASSRPRARRWQNRLCPRHCGSTSSGSLSRRMRCSCGRFIRKTTWRSMGLSRVATRCTETLSDREEQLCHILGLRVFRPPGDVVWVDQRDSRAPLEPADGGAHSPPNPKAAAPAAIAAAVSAVRRLITVIPDLIRPYPTDPTVHG